MKDKKLQKLNRKELLELLLEVTKEKESLQIENEQLKQQMNNKQENIQIDYSELLSKIEQLFDMKQTSSIQQISEEIQEESIDEGIIEEVNEEVSEETIEVIEEQEVIEVNEELSEEQLEELFEDDISYKDTYVERLDQFLNEHPSLRSFININDFNND